MYRDERLAGYDAAAVVEVIEHLDPPRLAAFERVLFEFARPAAVVITTPNAEYNVKWETLPAGKFRHKDHRFEWTRAEFQSWAAAIAATLRLRRALSPGRPGRCGGGAAHADGDFHDPRRMKITIPELALVVLIGPRVRASRRFARTHFKPTEVLSSDYCRGLVSDDENNQAATGDAFEVLHYIARQAAGARRSSRWSMPPTCSRRRVSRWWRWRASITACRWPSSSICRRSFARSAIAAATDRDLRPARHPAAEPAIAPLAAQAGARRLPAVFVLTSPEEVEAATIERQPLWNNRTRRARAVRHHRRRAWLLRELEELLTAARLCAGAEAARGRIRQGRKLIFVGDLVDRGPKIPETVRLVLDIGEGRPRLLRAGQSRHQVHARALGQERADHARPGRVAGSSSRRTRSSIAASSASRRNSSMRWSATTSSTTASWSWPTPA